MNQYLLRSKTIFVVLIIAFFNCVFASVKMNCTHRNNNLTTFPVNPPEGRPGIKKISFIKRYLHTPGFKLKKAGKGFIALVVIGAVLSGLLLAAGIFVAAYGGASTALLTVTGIVGLALIIFGAGRIIRGIKRKRGIANLNPTRSQDFGIENTVPH